MTLSAAVGRYTHTAALLADPAFAVQSFPTISRAFAPMVREQRFDVSELAIATFLQARAYGSDLVLLPVTLSARYQEGAMLRRAVDPFGPADLRGRRVGVRAFSQTTGLWLRGILADDFSITPPEIAWTTFEDAHVAAYADPPWATRAPPGSDLLAMLRDGQLDAAVFGAETPSAPDLAPVWPDPEAAARAFDARHHLVPVNHLLTVRPTLPEATIQTILAHLRPSTPDPALPFGRRALTPVLALANRYAAAQGLTPRPLTETEIWAGLPPSCQE